MAVSVVKGGNHVRANPTFDGWFEAHVGAQVKKITEEVKDDAIAYCPVDSGDLVSTIRTRYPGGMRGYVVVGSKGKFGDAPYWRYVEYGTAPHWIDSHGSWPLRDEHGTVFGRRVWHPGTIAQPFMRTALYQRRRLDRRGPL